MIMMFNGGTVLARLIWTVVGSRHGPDVVSDPKFYFDFEAVGSIMGEGYDRGISKQQHHISTTAP